MNSQPHYLYVRGLRQVDHTVFCVADGQKTYRDPASGRPLPFSSGQQVKRCILDEIVDQMSEKRAPVTFNYTLATKEKKQTIEQDEPWSPCDPRYIDQLIGGWMRAGKGTAPIKRRSPLSISAMRPIHPSLATLSRESVTFDRSDHPDMHNIRVVDDKGVEVARATVAEFLEAQGRNLPMRIWIPEDKVGPRASGLFVFDVAIDLRTLFSVSLNDVEPEITTEVQESLKDLGWTVSPDGLRIICPAKKRQDAIRAISSSMVNWRVTSNQSRTYSPQSTLALAVSHDANRVAGAIRADLTEESEFRRAAPVLEELPGTSLYIALPAKAYVPDIVASRDALDQAIADIASRLTSYNFEQ